MNSILSSPSINVGAPVVPEMVSGRPSMCRMILDLMDDLKEACAVIDAQAKEIVELKKDRLEMGWEISNLRGNSQ